MNRLSKRQFEVVKGLDSSKTVKELAMDFGVSNKTVEYHKAMAFRSLQVFDIAGLTRWAIRMGVICPLLLMSCFGAELNFEWRRSLSSNVISYRLYVASNGVVVATVPTVTTNAVWSNALAGINYAAWVTAVNTNGNTNVSNIESDPSEILEFTVPKAPIIFKFNAMNVHSLLEAAPLADGPFIPIYDFGSFPVVLADNQKFYRIRATIE